MVTGVSALIVGFPPGNRLDSASVRPAYPDIRAQHGSGQFRGRHGCLVRSCSGQLIPRATPTRTHRIGPEMSLYNDYLINIVVKQQHAELLAHAAEDRLARQLPGQSAPWWRRLVDGWRGPLRYRPESAGTRRAPRVRTVAIHGGTCDD